MNEDRRKHPRFPSLLVATCARGSSRFEAICTNLGPGGAFFAGRVTPDAGVEVEAVLRPQGNDGPRITMETLVVWSRGKGSLYQPGFGVTWLRAHCDEGVGPLRWFLREVLRYGDPGELQVDSQGAASFEFAAGVDRPPMAQPARAPSAPVQVSEALPPVAARPVAQPEPPPPTAPLAPQRPASISVVSEISPPDRQGIDAPVPPRSDPLASPSEPLVPPLPPRTRPSSPSQLGWRGGQSSPRIFASSVEGAAAEVVDPLEPATAQPATPSTADTAAAAKVRRAAALEVGQDAGRKAGVQVPAGSRVFAAPAGDVPATPVVAARVFAAGAASPAEVHTPIEPAALSVATREDTGQRARRALAETTKLSGHESEQMIAELLGSLDIPDDPLGPPVEPQARQAADRDLDLLLLRPTQPQPLPTTAVPASAVLAPLDTVRTPAVAAAEPKASAIEAKASSAEPRVKGGTTPVRERTNPGVGAPPSGGTARMTRGSVVRRLASGWASGVEPLVEPATDLAEGDAAPLERKHPSLRRSGRGESGVNRQRPSAPVPHVVGEIEDEAILAPEPTRVDAAPISGLVPLPVPEHQASPPDRLSNQPDRPSIARGPSGPLAAQPQAAPPAQPHAAPHAQPHAAPPAQPQGQRQPQPKTSASLDYQPGTPLPPMSPRTTGTGQPVHAPTLQADPPVRPKPPEPAKPVEVRTSRPLPMVSAGVEGTGNLPTGAILNESTMAYTRETRPQVPLQRGRARPVSGPWPASIPYSLSERYGRLEHLGHGGHGVVFKAVDKHLDRVVVLKFLAQSQMPTEMARKYFLREVKLAASLNHPNIVHIYDIGKTEDVLFYAMEFVDGVPLTAYLPQRTPLRDHAFLYSILAQLCEALDHAHGQGILHRDVKPDNVLVAHDGTVKLFDFGLARVTDEGFGEQSVLIGTPHYMAPEQLMGGRVDHRTDVYALGVLLFRMLAGVLPFSEGNVFAAHAVEPVPDPRRFAPELPERIFPILQRMMAKQPGERYDTCRAVALDVWSALFAPG